jgi:hypothetical protein
MVIPTATLPFEGRSEPHCHVHGEMVDQVSSLIEARRHRSDFFRTGLFSDPAWDILLDLTRAQLQGRRVCISSLCAAELPMTTAIRWINALIEEGLVVKLRDPVDARRTFVTLTKTALSSMKEYMISDANLQPPGVQHPPIWEAKDPNR